MQVIFLVTYNTLAMNKKIYFSGSIRGGRQDASLYHNIIKYIQSKDIVLTEHIGKEDLDRIENAQSDHDIYVQDTNWLKECDLVIAECTQASLGVGYELAFAENFNKPVYILYNKGKTKLSAMLAGNPAFHIFPYQTETEIFNILNSILA